MMKYKLAFVCLCIDFSISNIAVSQNPANPIANDKTKQVLRYLSGLKNKSDNRLLLGQDLGHGNDMSSGYDNYVEDLRNQTGKWIGMIGGDYGLDVNHDLNQTNQLLIDYWNEGGLVTLSWHLDNPWTGGSSWDTDNNEDLSELIDPQSPVYDVWRAQLAEIADALRPLRDAGVTVLWRPLHEMNGDWFWWGQKRRQGHEEDYKKLYIDMFNYLTYEQEMDNLLWVYSVGNTFERSLTNYYPGSQFVDVVGIDLYDDNANTFDPARDYRDMQSLGHPMGFTEFGPTISSALGDYDYRRLVSTIQNQYPDFVFSYAWHNWNQDGRQVSIAYADNQYAWETFGDPLVVTRDEIELEADEPAMSLPTGSPDLTGEVRIKNRWTNDYLHQSADQLGASVVLLPLNEEWFSQRWTIEAAEAGTYRFKCGWGGNYLSSTADRDAAPVDVYSFNSEWWSQMWHIESADSGHVRIKNRWNGRYLQSPDRFEIQTFDFNANAWSQMWVLEYFDGRDSRPVQGDTLELEIRVNSRNTVARLRNIDGPLDYEVFDATGEIALQGEEERIEISELDQGTYLVVGYLENEDGTERFARGVFTKE